MRIGFDAKRAFQNDTGLGNYSRTLLYSLLQFFPSHQYFLFAPKVTERFGNKTEKNLNIIAPSTWISKTFKGFWRRKGVIKNLIENKIELYHGLSHRIPNGIHKTNIPAVVSIHDLIFERFPKQYSFADRIFYRSQFKYACSNSEKVIAISEQTKKDLIDYYKVPEEKIEVCYQSCNPIFREVCSASEKENIRQLYNLPGRYFLCVGSIIERKNLLLICKAQVLLCEKLSIPLVVIGNGKVYKEKVKAFIEKENLQKQVIFLSDNVEANSNSLFKNSTHLPAIYQMAEALIYPSIFEGFGIPILEALCSDLPVIASNASCLPEAGGDAAIYFDPYNEHELADCMLKVANDTELKKQMIEKGKLHAEKFTEEKCAIAVMNVYKKILDK